MTVTEARPDLAPVVELLELRQAEGWHDGAQCYVSRNGEVLLDTTVGESRPGRGVDRDDLMLLYSAGKPLTVVALLQLWERGKLGLDDRVADYIDGWVAGKERCTIRHVLTHTGGFPNSDAGLFDADVPYADVVAHIAASPARWEPGTDAAYHPSSGWKILGAVVERVDGRPIDRYVREEVVAPLGLTGLRLGIPMDEQPGFGERIVPVSWRGHVLPVVEADGGLQMVPYKVDRYHNEPYFVAKVEPGGGMRGAARDLGRFYESLLGFGPAVLEPRTVEVMRAVHRFGIKDRLFRTVIPWGLGVQVQFSGGTGRRAFGHGGMASSRGLADPEFGLVMVVVSNALPGFLEAEQRLFEVTDAVYSALGDDVALTRQRVVPLQELYGFST
ncbi:MAG TPA: serine hydrolase domain-containing protein [Acidimicrobiia bacterium]|nr:serine hydrolase domain-containing protein [Acidimicrobiia bacterium]